jgi:hypothetical protein
MWTTVLQGCLNVLDAWLLCDRHATSLSTLWRHRPRPLARFCLVGRQCGERASLVRHWQSTIIAGAGAIGNVSLRGNAERRGPTFSSGLQDGQIDPDTNTKLSWAQSPGKPPLYQFAGG